MIPEWNPQGLIPPINEHNPAGMDRSPYQVDLVAFVERFAINLDRCAILEGYLSHRSELHRMGMIEGFQWLDGSFTENIELSDQRSPRDIDVVTFTFEGDEFYDCLQPDQLRLLGATWEDQSFIKNQFKVDFYVQSLSDAPERLVEITSYWYSMWSHRRTKQWKGFLRVDLAPRQDQAAIAMLKARKKELTHE
ncbi:DUF6932 family protein [Pseudomonas nunensis]|uniref:Uncharacterized protein n=1 Tax=Pseudomonas nunensis TaxID=2961896 RepID=A0ABY5E8L3_9PSED|nr:hypothetical protein [Pseudomonas nunensis]KPN91484.1 hypothetical protein AL066_14480 [Pseudomonas nunensis]MCL5229839.1 hypothetical protein [Pseudomonas nunensis]UTO11678.1 hypothetical protein NK667_15875 [Pseudomonas nunensis]